MFVGLLKCLKGRLESERHPRVQGTLESCLFGILSPTHFRDS